VEELEVEIILPAAPETAEMLPALSKLLGLPLHQRGMTSTFDRMLDTEDFALLAKAHTLRVRQKLDNVYAGNEIRLTYKYPLRQHDRLFIRAEHKLKLVEPEYSEVERVLNALAGGLSGQKLHTALHIRELASEAYLGEKGARVSVSFDQCSYSLPDHDDGPQEFVLELESHGVGEDIILKAADWVISELGGREAAQGKYARGLRLLGKL
jgi:inorganic triphosphatase YgiF